MIYPARLHTRLRSTTPEGQQDEIVQTYRAMVALRDNGTWSLRYTDTENHGQTALQGAPQWMSISRDGDTRSRLLFRVGERLESVYVSPMGEFQMHTHTTLFNATVEAEQGRVELHYELFLSDSLAAQNELEVWWERQT
ncbi:DUF1934 domain-containing protein [Alloprevotella sp. Lung230]|uniref:DUF1934 domain-containing protein n=1 Tax=Alloprevotella sp. Lung230 TaxID=2766595 RepID=UPI001655331F|nr:DUF1934 domain-containing protein [Alloprevotella sp. Lung230]MBC8626861.1 DUF1934 domain-containing protein [Alloprevotella sp. Lung230]